MARDGGRPEVGSSGPDVTQRPSLLRKLNDQIAAASQETAQPKSRFDSDSGAILATPESDMARSPHRKATQPAPTSPVDVAPTAEARLEYIGSETFSYNPQQIKLAEENHYDLSTVKGRARFASFLDKHYSYTPKVESKQSEEVAHRVATPNTNLEFAAVDNSGQITQGH